MAHLALAISLFSIPFDELNSRPRWARAGLNAAMAELIAKYQNDSAYKIAQAYGFRSETAKALEWLERSYKQRDGGKTDIKIDPLFKDLQGDSRYIELLKKMRLPT